MLMEVKSQLYATYLSIKYALQRELLNKVTFISNIIFMIINNGSFIIQWIILYSLRDDVGGYSFKQVLLLWGITSFTFGISRFFFKEAFQLTETINNGKLDNYLVQPKNVLISCITSAVDVSAIGDIIYGLIMLVVYGLSIKNILLFLICGLCGAFVVVSISIIFSSLSFWFGKTEMIADTINNLMVSFSIYPEGIFQGVIKFMFYTIIPLGITTYIPVQIISDFRFNYLIIVLVATIFFVTLAFLVFYKGLRRYSSANLMNVRI